MFNRACKNCKNEMDRMTIEYSDYLKDLGYKEIFHCSYCGSLAFNHSEESEPYHWITPELLKNYIKEN